MGKRRVTGYLSGLDGWRALSILAVMANHSRTFFVGGYSLRSLQDFGGEGVYFFFSISGLLICTRLLEEEKLTGRIDLKSFYLRRALRIQPAAFVYLLAVALVTSIGWFPQDWKYWFGALFTYRNYQIDLLNATVGIRGYLTGHFWTLAVEEHFYLLLSLFLFSVRSRRALWLGLLYIPSLFMLNVVLRLYSHVPEQLLLNTIPRHTEQQIQFLIPASLLALLLFQPGFRAWATRWLRPEPLIALTLAGVFLSICLHARFPLAIERHSSLMRYLLPTWDMLILRLCPLWIVATVLHPESLTTRFLELPPLVWIGRISYSLYLWHVLFFRGPWPATLPQPPSPLVALSSAPWNLLAALACATASFYWLERPLMRLGHRLAPPSTPGRLDLTSEPSIEGSRESSREESLQGSVAAR